MITAPTRPGTVPYITQWSGEPEVASTVVFAGQRGIAYANGDSSARDARGVLWMQRRAARGSGRPMFGKVHPLRQRKAMSELLCQVCGGAADLDDRGVLWLLEDCRRDWPRWPEELLTAHPPVCLSCAREAIKTCPHLLRGWVAVRVGSSEVCAVYGRLYSPSALRPVPGPPGVAALDSPAISWVVASQLVRALERCTFVDLRVERP